MNDIFIARRAEIEAEAKRRDTTPAKLVDELVTLVDNKPGLAMTMRNAAHTMRAQFDPQPHA